ncbi:zinc ribbon domain-containing protein [Myxacorys almedinensis]|uniref:Zinc ribbon domain-containing protein n=1 Tax=Myxacorys almedinensis A TaxID=2690445 RepID=A0A8J7Z7F4_9CYAN|nr:zinc ribbon domain-containing protein [Myxacorys almedinensis]NDJ17788.1 zinc ribbon domain-containing protein [Myxacorys almedinensis A]
MLSCPKCHQPLKKRDAIVCPHCRTELKAHGHAGIPLYRATGKEPLCRTCLYDADDTCNYPQRPDAWECTLYRDTRLVATVSTPTSRDSKPSPQVWVRRNIVWVAIAGLLVVSFLIAASKR